MPGQEPLALWVYLDGRHAAAVTRTRVGLRLRYEQEHLQAPGALPLSVSLPLTEEPHTGSWVVDWLQSHLPEDGRLLDRYAEAVGVSPTDPVGLLASPLGADCAGAVQFCAPEASEALLSRPSGLMLLEGDKLIDELRLVVADSKLRDERASLYCSIPGFHRKLALRQERDCWYRPYGAEPSTHILKPALPERKVVAVTEYMMLTAARTLGLDAPLAALEQHGKMTVLVSERYDRRKVEGVWARIHQEDMCQAFRRPHTAKAERRGGPTIAEISRLLEIASPTPGQCRARFAAGLLFAWLTLNIDAHGGNYSLIYRGSSPQLAPLYDLNTSLPFTGKPVERLRLAMTYGGVERIGDIDREPTLTRLARTIGVTADLLASEARRLGGGLCDAIADALRGLDRQHRKGLRSDLKALQQQAAQRAALFRSL